jgi:Cytidylate kinase-like family
MDEKLYAITISHQLGSGGAPVGKKLSERLNIPFFDREILKRVSNRLHLAETDLGHREPRPGFAGRGRGNACVPSGRPTRARRN